MLDFKNRPHHGWRHTGVHRCEIRFDLKPKRRPSGAVHFFQVFDRADLPEEEILISHFFIAL
jgi:hypothetical protein